MRGCQCAVFLQFRRRSSPATEVRKDDVAGGSLQRSCHMGLAALLSRVCSMCTTLSIELTTSPRRATNEHENRCLLTSECSSLPIVLHRQTCHDAMATKRDTHSVAMKPETATSPEGGRELLHPLWLEQGLPARCATPSLVSAAQALLVSSR